MPKKMNDKMPTGIDILQSKLNPIAFAKEVRTGKHSEIVEQEQKKFKKSGNSFTDYLSLKLKK